MANKVISVSLSADGIAKAIQEVKLRKKWIESKMDEFARRVAEKGCVIAQKNYQSPEGKVVVSIEAIDNGYVIHANGRDVCFLEFGAGVSTSTDHPYASEMPFEVRPGSWSEEHSKQFSEKGYWFHNGKKMYGISPTKSMSRTVWQLEYDVYQIAREVFK